MTDKVTFGKTTWDSPRQVGGGAGGDDFLQLNKDGQYELRIIGEAPFEFAVHWTEDVNGAKRKTKCAGHDCVLCKEGIKAQVRYLLEVMNRGEGEGNKCQIVEFGSQVYNQIVALNNSRHWGDPRKYDILIDRKQARGPSDMYQVMAVGAIAPLDPELQAKASEFRERMETVIEKVAGAATNEEILKKLGRDGGGAASGGGNWGQPAPAPATPAAAEEDDSFNF